MRSFAAGDSFLTDTPVRDLRAAGIGGHADTGARMVDDQLLHEMLHLELARHGADIHDGSEDWDALAGELSPEVLGRKLRLLKDAMRPNYRSYGPEEVKMTGWPYDFRPGNYSWGRKIPLPAWCR